MIENQNIICFGFAEWDNPYRTNQHHIMEKLCSKNRVLFIESLGLRRPSLQKKDIKRIFRRIFKAVKGVKKISANLFIFSPLVIPFHKYKIIRFINKLFLQLQLNSTINKLNFKSPILWSYIPNAVEFIGKWHEKLSVYHCVDELSANPLIPLVVREIENRFLSKVNVVFTTSKLLFEDKSKRNSNIYYLPNVADFSHFNKAVFETTEIPVELEKIKSPKIGFIGAISKYKLDFKLILNIANKNKNWSFIFIGAKGEGEKEADLSELDKQNNIYFFGGKPYSLLPNYLKGFDVCILPNLLNEYTRNMFPMKFFEYLASGKPVVSTNLNALLEFGNFCYLSKNEEEFEANIKKALLEDSNEIITQRINLAKQHTWDSRIEDMSKILLKQIADKPASTD